MKTPHLTIILVTILISGLLISSYLPTASSTCIFGANGNPTSCNSGPYILTSYPPPLQQVRHGIPSSQVKCNEGFVNIFKTAGGSPACVTLATAVNLVDRGSWLTNVQTVWFSYEPSVTTPWLGNIPSDISTNHTEQCTMANSTWGYFKNQGITPFEILWTYPNLVAGPEGVVGEQPKAGFLVHVLPNESSIMSKLGFKERSDVYYPLDLSLTPRLSVCDDSSGETRSLTSPFGSGNHISHTNSIRDTSFIKLFLTTNSTIIRQGQTIGVDIWISNTSSNNLTMNYDDNWPWKRLTLYPCVVGMPFGVALLEGNYSLQNLTAAKQLSLYQNGTYNCPMERYDHVNAYAFEPSSDNATLETPAGNFTSEMRYSLSVNGFYGPANDFQALADGEYTIVAGDEWRHIALQHFTVSNSTQAVSVTSIKMIPPYTPGGPVIQLTLENAGAKPITNIKAMLELYNNYTFDFTNVTSSSPLLPNNYATNATMLVGGGFQTEVAYPLVISGMEGNIPFAYTMKVQIQG
ncbi:MAG: hypothetical protein KGH88_06500 [Thaumarchaeota archaeon]|nr:hypothetical protein [Nitrososphaerota archaeon]